METYIRITDWMLCQHFEMLINTYRTSGKFIVKDLDNVTCEITYDNAYHRLNLLIDEDNYYIDVLYDANVQTVYWNVENNISFEDFGKVLNEAKYVKPVV
jgi:hypothetical protein